MKRNQQELLDLMYFNKLSASDVASMLSCTPNTVRVWRCNARSAMPDSMLELLKLKLQKTEAV